MKKTLILLALLFAANFIFSQSFNNGSKYKFEIIDYSEKEVTIKFKLGEYSLQWDRELGAEYSRVVAKGGALSLEKGAPEVSKFVSSLILPQSVSFSAELIDSKSFTISSIKLVPSKGNLYRDIDPVSVEYSFGKEYNRDKFYPKNQVAAGRTYSLRQFKAQTLEVFPFAYNPINEELKVYNEMTIKLRFDGRKIRGQNSEVATSIEFENIFQNHFLNYAQVKNLKYNAIPERGNMLIISHPDYMPAMEEFVYWKNTIGFPTEMVSIDDIGNNATSIKNYVLNYYNTNGLTFLLLVGDAQHITPGTMSGDKSDTYYGLLEGNDSYPEVFVGRFSAESVQDVEIQVRRTIDYEKSPLSEEWLSRASGLASDEGPGYQNLYDYEHMRVIRNTLLDFTFNSVGEFYDGSQGGEDAPGHVSYQQIADEVNSGTALINYVGHGSETSWVTSNFSNTRINALTNHGKYPYIWSVACVNGAFVGRTCFAEAWLRAQNQGEPTGALAVFASTINQSWVPPMAAQMEMNDILTEKYSDKTYRTYGGVSFHGCMFMNDAYGYSGDEMTNTWTIFGDPSVMLRTDVAENLIVVHEDQIMIEETSITLACNVDNAFATLSKNGNILGTAIVNNNEATINFEELTDTENLTLTVTAFNYIPHIGEIEVIEILLENDIELVSILQPEEIYTCIGIDLNPKIAIRNKGEETLTEFTAKYKINDNDFVELQWSGNLLSMQRDTIELSHFTLESGVHTILVELHSPNGVEDDNMENNSKTKSFEANDLPLSVEFSSNFFETCSYPIEVSFINLSENALDYFWDFGDGNTSSEFEPTHTYEEPGFYTVNLYAFAGVCDEASVSKEDFIKIGLIPLEYTTNYVQDCAPASVSFEVSGSENTKWYSDSLLTNIVASGSTFETPILNNPQKYYVRNEIIGENQNVGKVDNSGSGGYFGNAQNIHFLIFDCNKPMILNSVKVYANGSGNRTIELRNSSGTVIESKTLYISTGESRINLDFNIPVGDDLQLAATGVANLYRNNENTGLFPYYSTDSSIVITESSASLPAYNAPGNYYYFYDWEVQEPSCVSSTIEMTADVLPKPIVNFATQIEGANVQFTNNTQYADTYYWDFGDGNTSSEENPSHNYNATDDFTVKLIAEGLCGSDSISQSISVSNLLPIADFNAQNTVIFIEQMVQFLDLSQNEPTEWQWTFEGGEPQTSTSKNPLIKYSNEGTFSVKLVVRNINGSDSITKTNYVKVETETSIDEYSINSKFRIYPNPISNENLRIYTNELNCEKITINIFNNLGQKILPSSIKSCNEDVIEIETKALSKGFYHIHIEDNNNQTYTYKLIVN